MSEPAYVQIAGEIAREIRSGVRPVRSQLPSYSELAKQHSVSDIVIRRAMELLLRQGLVYTVERRGTFVASRPTLRRVSPERQMEDPEVTYSNEAADKEEIRIDRETSIVPADSELAEIFGIEIGNDIEHQIVMASDRGRAASISDSYLLPGTDVGRAEVLEETLADRPPVPAHAEWLEVPTGELVKTVHQRFLLANGRVLMVSDVSYPNNRYDSFVFRMVLDHND
ncbi:GntR family transcriptional regulator [Nocardia sp. CNY236]|uniref:GntR family transcriptional regulator n=1 Tax=Nocardia sp. CNY236 TaxID=1169152 RepID=UPI00041F3BA3|nr:GntR family transcriptional regulator [Nocardia sp. CNY236]